MNTTNPLQPQGSLPPKGKSNIRIAIFTILAIHVVLLGGLLIQGCKPGAKNDVVQQPIEAPVTEVAPLTDEFVESMSAPGVTSSVTPEVISATLVNTTSSVGTTIETGTPNIIDQGVSTSTMETKTHTIAKGEMLYTIAKKYGISVKALEEANPGINPTKLQIGQQLNVPAPAIAAAGTSTVPEVSETVTSDHSVYTVKSGDALEKIARHHGTTVKAIKSANNMKTDRIYVGQKLKIPAKAAASSELPSGSSNG